MIDMIAQYVHKAIEATTPWLVGAAIGFLVLWLGMLCRRAGPFAKELKWFFSLTPLHKFIVIFAVGLVAGLFSIAGNWLGSSFFKKGGSRAVKPIMITVLVIFFVKVLYEVIGA